jgi:hypothetical protein
MPLIRLRVNALPAFRELFVKPILMNAHPTHVNTAVNASMILIVSFVVVPQDIKDYCVKLKLMNVNLSHAKMVPVVQITSMDLNVNAFQVTLDFSAKRKLMSVFPRLAKVEEAVWMC